MANVNVRGAVDSAAVLVRSAPDAHADATDAKTTNSATERAPFNIETPDPSLDDATRARQNRRVNATTFSTTLPAASQRIRQARLLAWTLWSISIVCVGLSLLLIIATISVDTPSRGFGFRGWVPLVGLLWATIGARIAARQPAIAVGWLILAVGFLWSVNALFEEYATYAYFPQELDLPLVPQSVWFNNLVGPLIAGISAITLLVVPDGRLSSRRWYALVLVVIVVTGVSVLTYALLPRRLAPFPFENPFALETLRALAPSFPTILRTLDVARGLEVLLPTAVLLLRLRASTGVQRQQLKWVAYAATFAAVLVFVYAFVDNVVVQYAQILGLVLVPLSFGIAMRRFRLYEIDRILNRTIVLGGSTAVIAGLYTASVGLMQRLFIALTGERSDAAVVLTTLLVAAAFTPVKDWIQAFVKRNFGTDVPGTKGLDTFANEIDEHLRLSDRDRLLAQLLAESVGSLGAVGGALEFTDEGATHAVRTLGAWTGGAHLSVDVRERGDVVARLHLGPRANGGSYDAVARKRVERAASIVGMALDRLGQPMLYGSLPKTTGR
jgi:hypothetical protein